MYTNNYIRMMNAMIQVINTSMYLIESNLQNSTRIPNLVMPISYSDEMYKVIKVVM